MKNTNKAFPSRLGLANKQCGGMNLFQVSIEPSVLSWWRWAAVVFALCYLCGLRVAAGQTPAPTPKDRQLYDTILHMDGVMFDAFNRCDLDTLKTVFAENVEFYNDGGGLGDYQTTMNNFKTMFERNATTGLRRELVKESLEVYPMPGFGAVETGTHRFIHTENGKEEVGTMKFIQVWQFKEGQWKATRVISLGH